jgi:NADH-quinone oxidoreductase subunit J
MVTNRKPMTAAISMVATMFCLAGLYVLLDAHLMAALQIIIYAGTIMVLFLFVIMLLNLREKEGDSPIEYHSVFVQFLIISAVGYLFVKVVELIKGDKELAIDLLDKEYGTTAAVGKVLFTKYILPFEAASLLLLAAVVGAVVLAKNLKKKKT